MSTVILLKVLKTVGWSVILSAIAIGYGATSLVVSDKVPRAWQFWFWLAVLTVPTIFVLYTIFF